MRCLKTHPKNCDSRFLFSQMYTIALLLPVECFISFGTAFTHCIVCCRNKTFRFEKRLWCEKYALCHYLLANRAFSLLWSLRKLLSWRPIFMSNLCNSFQDSVFEWIAVAWPHGWQYISLQGPLLLTWNNFNPRIESIKTTSIGRC